MNLHEYICTDNAIKPFRVRYDIASCQHKQLSSPNTVASIPQATWAQSPRLTMQSISHK